MRLKSKKQKYVFWPQKVFLHTIIKKFLNFRAENSGDILYLVRKLIMLAFRSLLNYIDQLT